MSSINCNVNNCGHNDGGMCYASKISINGKKSRTSTHTCCNTFVEESNGSFTNSADNSSNNTFIGCNVNIINFNPLIKIIFLLKKYL